MTTPHDEPDHGTREACAAADVPSEAVGSVDAAAGVDSEVDGHVADHGPGSDRGDDVPDGAVATGGVDEQPTSEGSYLAGEPREDDSERVDTTATTPEPAAEGLEPAEQSPTDQPAGDQLPGGRGRRPGRTVGRRAGVVADSGQGEPAPSSSGSGGSAARTARELGVEMRQFRVDLGRLRGDLGELTGLLEQLGGRWRSTTGHVSELLPRVAGIEDELAGLAARLDAQEADAESDGGLDGPSWTPTPAVGWENMDRAASAAAWEALASWVGETLAEQYRLTRLQLPDCWPLHPRVVRELAWLRTTYLAAGDKEARDQAEAGDTAEWHARWIGFALVNIAVAIDPRECRPGIHRLTEQEVEVHQAQQVRHQRGEGPAPVLTRETGPERPRLRPEHFPTRTAEPSRGQAGTGPTAPTVRLLPLLLVEPATPCFWIEHYREASRVDIDRREDLADVV